ncbi:hypothetical protein L1049_008354 [Liquidambar formosana]|uniref:Uncharacterized protein n=1 Tax=Liquidambar formosana TaxID=63359 RepID=A0AAP0S6B2_LIQFO
MAEEHRCEAPEGHRLCANNCGFFGSPGTQNLCSKCYRDLCLKEQHASSAKTAVENSLAASSMSSSPPSTQPLYPPVLTLPDVAGDVRNPAAALVEHSQQPPASAQPNRCLVCKKRVGLTGFRCKCEITFCGVHRYPEKHACTFDFKKEGRDAIARANPVVVAEKLEKI